MSNQESKSTAFNAENALFGTDNAYFAGMSTKEMIDAMFSQINSVDDEPRQPSPDQLGGPDGLKFTFDSRPSKSMFFALLRGANCHFPVDDTGESHFAIRVDSGDQEALATHLVGEMKRLGIEPGVVVFDHGNAYFDADLGRVVYNDERSNSADK